MFRKKIEDTVALYQTHTWPYFALLILITVFAAGLRFFKLGEWSFWIDEIYTINHALAHFRTPELILQHTPPFRNWIPVSVILTAQAINAWGITEWNARFVSAVIGILTLPVLYVPAKKMFGARIALIALVLLAISPWHIFWSQNARFYTSMMLFYTLALFAFFFGIEENKPKYLFLFFILVYLAASERFSALLIFAVIAVYLAVIWIFPYEKPKGLNFRNLAIIALPIFIGGVIELYSSLVKGETRFFGDFYWFLQYQIDDPLRLLVFVGNNLGIPMMVMAVFSGFLLLSKRSRPGLLMLTSALVPLLILVVLNTFVFTKDRYMFITLFSWIILTVIGINEAMLALKGNGRWLALGLFLIFFAHSANDMLLYYHANHGNRLEWKSAFNIVKERAEKGDVVVAFWPEFGPYYMDRTITAYQEEDLNIILKEENNYWFVLDSETIWLNGDVKYWVENNAELVEVWYLRRPEDSYLRLYRFDPSQDKNP